MITHNVEQEARSLGLRVMDRCGMDEHCNCTEQEGGFYLTSHFIVSKLDSLFIINKNPIWRKPVFVFVPDAPRCKQRNSCHGNQKHDLKKKDSYSLSLCSSSNSVP